MIPAIATACASRVTAHDNPSSSMMACSASATPGVAGLPRPRRRQREHAAHVRGPRAEHDDAIAELHGLLDVVGHEHDGARPLGERRRPAPGASALRVW